MTSISILHASDLHIAHHKQLRSLLDQLGDLEDPWDKSVQGIVDKLRLLKGFLTCYWKETSASSCDPETLEALAEFVYASAKHRTDIDGNLEQNPQGYLDAVILTGDLATTGAQLDLEKVQKFFKAPASFKVRHRAALKDYKSATLSAVQVPIIYLPGNHDRYIPTLSRHDKIFPRFFDPGGTGFDQMLSDYRKEPVRRDEIAVSMPDGNKFKVVIFSADFSLQDFQDHEGLFGWLAQGKVYSDIRRKLVSATKTEVAQSNSSDVLCVLWAIHFPPAYPGVKTHSRLLGDERLISLANESGVCGILAGHTHKQLKYGHPAAAFEVFCCGTTTQFEPLTRNAERLQTNLLEGNLFQVITINVNELRQLNLTVKHYRYTADNDGSDAAEMSWRPLT